MNEWLDDLIATFVSEYLVFQYKSKIWKKLSVINFSIHDVLLPWHYLQPGKKYPLKLGLKIAPNIGWMNPSTKGYSSDGARFGGTIGFISDIYFAENYAFFNGTELSVHQRGNWTTTDSMLVDGSKKTG